MFYCFIANSSNTGQLTGFLWSWQVLYSHICDHENNASRIFHNTLFVHTCTHYVIYNTLSKMTSRLFFMYKNTFVVKWKHPKWHHWLKHSSNTWSEIWWLGSWIGQGQLNTVWSFEQIAVNHFRWYNSHFITWNQSWQMSPIKDSLFLTECTVYNGTIIDLWICQSLHASL